MTILIKALLGFGAWAVTFSASASLIAYTALLSGPAESPPNASPGSGFAQVSIDTVTNLMRVRATFSGLLGTTTASHIHCCTAVPGAGAAGVATTTPSFFNFPLGVTSGTYDQIIDLTMASSYNPAFVTANGGTIASAEAVLLAGLATGATYFNIHTSTFPGGEIRGFLAPAAIPEPWTAGLAAIGLAAALAARRRPRR